MASGVAESFEVTEVGEVDCFTWLHVLYRLYDAAGQVIYIGITNDIRARFGWHSRQQQWWPEVADCKIEFFPDRVMLETAEVAAIQQECPRHNKSQGWISLHEPESIARCVSRRDSKSAAVVENMVRLIAARTRGDQLPTESELCDQFAVSRTTVRGALKRLADFGLITSVRGHGWYVAATVCPSSEASVLASAIRR